MKALVLHQRQVHVLHSETNTHVQFVTALNTLYLKKKKLQRILIWKLNFRIKSEIIIMIIYTYRYMIFRYSNLKIDMNKYWYLATLKKKHLHCKCTYTGTYMYITYSLPCPSGCGHTLSGGARDGWPLYSGTGQSRGSVSPSASVARTPT